MKRVLIADDDETNRDLIRKALRKDRWEVVEARDGVEALTLARDEKPDLLILDIMMPVKNGYEVCEELKRLPATASIPILFLSARHGPATRESARAAGGDEFMEKPFSPRELRELVEKMMND